MEALTVDAGAHAVGGREPLERSTASLGAVSVVRDKPLRDKDGGRERRRGISIMAFCGKNGEGKTMAAVHDTLPTLDGVEWHCTNPDHLHTKNGVTSGVRRVLSTVVLLDSDTGRVHPLFDLFTDWQQLLDLEHGDVVMDEMIGVASSRESSALPPEIENRLHQLRHYDVVVRWTAVSWARAEKVIREATQAVTVSRAMFPDRSANRAAKKAGKSVVAAWAPNRLFIFRTFAMEDFAEFTESKGNAVGAKIKGRLWGPNSRAFASYNTLGSVSRVINGAELCDNCGLKLPGPRRKTCRCDAHNVRMHS